MQGRVETAYGKLLTYFKLFISPFKKVVMHTECQIHKMINLQSLEILKNDKYIDAYNFFSDFITSINEGAVWADQDMRSSGHFYSPVNGKGLYGNTNALTLALEYYNNALKSWSEGKPEEAMFHLGATVHLVQDVTIPQHANIRLLDNHRQFESFIRRTYLNTPRFAADRGGYYIDSIKEAVTCNARNAIKIYNRLKHIKDISKRFYTISKFIIPLAQKTTAGCFLRFYKDVGKRSSLCRISP
ncbi:MAG: zinc dependent phospholipase C family protein [Clostridia bacterium]|nr:zinc dependent phospholipase C family protein [Clostridia bacterium]